MDKSISIIVPVYNEEKNLPVAIADLLSSMKRYRHGFEIVVVDDGSTDSTGSVADQLAKTHTLVRVVHHPTNKGFGAAFRTGIAQARKTWLVPFHGDNDSSAVSLRQMIDRIGEADIISAYTTNNHARTLIRRVISRAFIFSVDLLFAPKLRYYTGYFITKKKSLATLRLISAGLPIYAETKIRLLAAGCSVIEVPTIHTGRKHGTSKVIHFATVVDTLRLFSILIREVGFRGAKRQVRRLHDEQ